MAKGNVFLGTAVKSLGDVTLYRREGVQVSRVRVRKIANPKTEGQARQRMLMASLTRFYSPLAVCLEKSFEGKNKSKSYSEFLHVNALIGKDNFAVPKNAGFIPVPVKLSAGTMPSPTLSYSETDVCFNLNCPDDEGVATLGAISRNLMNGYGLSEGDQVTIIFVRANNGADGVSYTPSYFRFFIKPNSSDAAPNYMGVNLTSDSNSNLCISNLSGEPLVAAGIIFSRYENGSWRRSNSYMALNDDLADTYAGEEAVLRWLDSWMSETSTPISAVYLNGSTGSTLAPHAGVAVVTIGGVEYRFIGAGHRTIDGTDYAYLITEDGERMYIKCGNELSDAYGKFATAASMQTESLTQMGESTSSANPTGVDNAHVLTIDTTASTWTASLAEHMVEFATAHGWTSVGAAIWFGQNG